MDVLHHVPLRSSELPGICRVTCADWSSGGITPDYLTLAFPNSPAIHYNIRVTFDLKTTELQPPSRRQGQRLGIYHVHEQRPRHRLGEPLNAGLGHNLKNNHRLRPPR